MANNTKIILVTETAFPHMNLKTRLENTLTTGKHHICKGGIARSVGGIHQNDFYT